VAEGRKQDRWYRRGGWLVLLIELCHRGRATSKVGGWLTVCM
jgi:hypothetical protein